MHGGGFASLPNLAVHRNEGGMGCQKVVGQSQVRHFFAALPLFPEPVVIGKERNAVACPEITKGRIFRQRRDPCHCEGLGIGSFPGDSRQRHMATGFPTPFSEEDHGTLGQNIGQGNRFHIISGKAFKIHLHLGQYRCRNHGAEALRPGLRCFPLVDDERLAHAGPRHPFDEVAVDARPDSEGKQVGVVEIVPDEIEDLFLNGHIAVGDDDQGPRVLFALFEGEGALQGRQYFRSAAAPLALKKSNGPPDIFRRGRQGLLGHQGRTPGEEQDVEPVRGAQAADQVG